MAVIRREGPADSKAVQLVNERAFGGEAEADLVDALRQCDESLISKPECEAALQLAKPTYWGMPLILRLRPQGHQGQDQRPACSFQLFLRDVVQRVSWLPGGCLPTLPA
jgi:hypothetical protein